MTTGVSMVPAPRRSLQILGEEHCELVKDKMKLNRVFFDKLYDPAPRKEPDLAGLKTLGGNLDGYICRSHRNVHRGV